MQPEALPPAFIWKDVVDIGYFFLRSLIGMWYGLEFSRYSIVDELVRKVATGFGGSLTIERMLQVKEKVQHE